MSVRVRLIRIPLVLDESPVVKMKRLPEPGETFLYTFEPNVATMLKCLRVAASGSSLFPEVFLEYEVVGDLV